MRIALAALMTATALTGVQAQTHSTASPAIIELREGGQTVLTVNRPFSSVAVANPEIADALPRSDRVLVLVGKKVGASDIIIFSDADKLYHATIVVAPSAVSGKVITHNKKDLSLYNAYQCNPVCQRIEDKFESKGGFPEIVVLGGGGPQATGGSINLIVPPPAQPR